LLSRPELGAASNSQAMAPRNGGVTNDAVTSARTALENGRSVRATSQPIGAAARQQKIEALTDRINVVTIGARNSGSVSNVLKLSSVNAPDLSTTL
jgi:hypothetical protein